MMKNSLKPLIRRIVLTTYFPPFAQIYKLYYWLVSQLVLRTLKKFSGVKAVYLRRGVAKGKMLPLISDLDFAVIGKGMDNKHKESMRRAYKNLADLTLVLDKALEIYGEEKLFDDYTSGRRRYRLVEGKETWKLIYGKDYLAELPRLPIDKIYDALFHEMKLWWSMFCWLILEARENHDEMVIRNSVCYKTVSEVLKINLAFHHGIITFSRSEAIELSKPNLCHKAQTLVERLESIARNRFLSENEGLVEDAKDFVINYLDGFCREFLTHKYVRSLNDVSQNVDCSRNEMFLGEQEYAHMERLIEYVGREWAQTYRGAYVVTGCNLHIDEVALLLEIDPKQLPSAHDIKTIYNLHRHSSPLMKSRIHIFLLLPHAALKIDADDLRNGWKFILSPCSNPDLFALLGRAEFSLEGWTFRPVPSLMWTPLIRDMILQRKKELEQKLQLSNIDRKNSLRFLRRFWTAVQLALITRSMQTDEVFYPLTLPSIKRGLALHGVSLPSKLQSLEDAYRDVLGGKNCDISALIPDAVNYLKEIDS